MTDKVKIHGNILGQMVSDPRRQCQGPIPAPLLRRKPVAW